METPLKTGWSYSHDFGVISVENWGSPFLVVTENKYWNGQSWGYTYWKLKDFETTEIAKKECEELKSKFNNHKYLAPDQSQDFLLAVQKLYPDAKISV